MAAPQQQFVTVAQQSPSQRPGYSERYNASGGMATGVVQLICAILLIAAGGAAYGLAASYVSIYVSDAGVAIWSSIILFLPAGILGIASKNRNSCVITAYMVMSILSCLASFGVFFVEAVFAYFLGIGCTTPGANCSPFLPYIIVLAISATLFFVEFITSLIGSIYCCGGVCCGASNTTTTTSTTMVQYPAGGPVASQPGNNYVVSPPQTGYGAPAPQYAMDVRY